MMRVITGIARGRRLETLPGDDITRPTTESVKEALFSIIQFEIEGKKILDLFAGSGQLGIEALSRGARHCTFVEGNKQAAAVVERNIKHCRLEDNSSVICGDALAFLMRKGNYDIAFLDPPYKDGLMSDCLKRLIPNMTADGIIVCETSANEELPDELENGWKVFRSRRYGKTKLTLYRRAD